MQNVVVNMSEKFHNNWFRNDTSLGSGKSDNKKKNNVRSAWRPVSGSKNGLPCTPLCKCYDGDCANTEHRACK